MSGKGILPDVLPTLIVPIPGPKLIMSGPGFEFAKVIASLSEPGPVSFELVTVKAVGAPSADGAPDRFAGTRNFATADSGDLIGALTMVVYISFDRALPDAAIEEIMNTEKNGDATPNTSDARTR